ncbi:MAG: hypothetical protein Q8Q44_05020, partial [Nocardioides sp.]|nr:hypothetical protein [Nocardioides sp.]
MSDTMADHAPPAAPGPAPVSTPGPGSGPAPGVGSGTATAGEVLGLVRSGRATTRAEVGRLTGLSRTAVSARLAGLLDRGLVLEGEQVASTGGRPAARLHFNRRAGAVLA